MFRINLNIETCLIGKRTVGKTSFVDRLKDDEFNQYLKETNTPQFSNILLVSSKAKYKLKIIDIPGNQVECNQIFIEDRPLLLFFFDLTDLENTFEPILQYLEIASKNLLESRTMVLFGTKKDLVENVGNYYFLNLVSCLYKS